ncbi:MAG: hypothetical protein E7585_03705 [Ruminococcaceae bacterium]|nr:hypothetical protein [Oscillospiraceae bacterium]
MDRLTWFKRVGYGLFVHFGLYSILGGVYKGTPSPRNAEWIMRHLRIPVAEYKKLAEVFDPTALDPDAIVRRAKAWGMQYVVVTAKHHDGFALYDSKVSDYNVMNTPYGRDVIKAFADACAKEGMPFGIYYSQMQDWEHPDGNGNTWDYDPANQDFSRYFYGKALPQVKELLTNYGDLCLLWFDTPYDMPKALCRELADTVKAIQPDCLINGRIGYGLGDYRQMANNSIPRNVYHGAFEVPMTLNRSWGYSALDTEWATPGDVIRNLVQIRGRGGNLLLNIGPDGCGNVPKASTNVLDAVGAWLERNGESIFDTDPFPDLPYINRWGDVTYRKESNTLYLHILKYPGLHPRISLLALASRVAEAKLLKDGIPLNFTQAYDLAREEHRLSITVPAAAPDPVDTVIAVTLADTPRVQEL